MPPIQSQSEIADLLAIMRLKEATTYHRGDYLINNRYSNVVDASWRQRIVEWMFGVVDTCALRRDAVAVATYYLDLCVERNVLTSKQDFQCAAMAALQLAIKLYDSTILKLDSMVQLGRGLFTARDIIDMESKMLSALRWQVHPPTPVCFLRQYLRLLPPTTSSVARYVIGEVTRFVSEISVCIYKFSQYPPSAMAYASMLIAMDRIDPLSFPSWQREEILEIMAQVAQMDYKSPDMQRLVAELHHSLDHNVSIQDLMQTIDAQCRQESYRKQALHPNKTSSSGSPRSPRDVRSS